MPVIFKGQFAPKGLIKIRRIDFDDWWLTSELEERFEDRGSVNDTVSEYEDWGRLPKAPTQS